jgi:methyl-accepting chemotaxis protein
MNHALSIRNWLLMMGGGAIGMLLLLGGVSIYNARQLDAAVGEASAVGQAVRRQMEADMMHDAIRSDVLDALLAAAEGQGGDATALAQALNGHIGRLEANLRDNSGPGTSEAVRLQATTIAPVLARYTRSARDIVATAFTSLPAARARRGEFDKDFAALEQEMEALSELIQGQSTRTGAHARAILKANLYEVSGVLLAALLVLTWIALRLIGMVGKPLEGLADAARTIERTGDLTLRVPVGADNEIGHTVIAFNSLLDSLQGIVHEVRGCSVSILDNSRLQPALHRVPAEEGAAAGPH